MPFPTTIPFNFNCKKKIASPICRNNILERFCLIHKPQVCFINKLTSALLFRNWMGNFVYLLTTNDFWFYSGPVSMTLVLFPKPPYLDVVSLLFAKTYIWLLSASYVFMRKHLHLNVKTTDSTEKKEESSSSRIHRVVLHEADC